MRTALIVEPNPTGHRLYYVRLLAEAAVLRGERVVLALSEGALTTDESRLHLSKLPAAVDIVSSRGFDVAAVADLSRRFAATTTVIPDGDRFAMRLARSRKWAGHGTLSILIMREVAQPRGPAVLVNMKTWLRTQLFRRAARIAGVRISILKSAMWRGTTFLPSAPDPVSLCCTSTDIASVRAEWGLDANRYWFAVLGDISHRKNVTLVARALHVADVKQIGLLIAGRCDPSATRGMAEPIEALKDAGAKVVVINRLLTDAELDAAVATIDCLVLAHSNEGPSGLFGKAAVSGTRVVAAGAQSLREDVGCAPGMATWCPLDIVSVASALQSARTTPRPGSVLTPETRRFADALL